MEAITLQNPGTNNELSSFVRLDELPVFLLHLHTRESPAFPRLRYIRRVGLL